MSVSEVAWRVRQVVQAQFERIGFGRCHAVSPTGKSGAPWCRSVTPGTVDVAEIVNAAEAVLSGHYDVFALRGFNAGFPPDWNRDPRTGIQAPMVFGKSIDYRDESIVGDIKYLWEINRHLELVTLAQAFHQTRDERYATACMSLLEDWMEACPYPMGPNWTSSLEHAYRLVNWCVVWHLLGSDDAPIFGGTEGQSFRLRWLESVRQHCHFIFNHLSLHSSANNHLIGELTGLLVGALTWPMWSESVEWTRAAHDSLEREGLLQNASDGVNLEQAFHYQRSVVDMLLFAGLVGRENGVSFSGVWWERIERMIEFVAACTDVRGGNLAIGDSDDALLVRWDPTDRFNPNLSLIATGAALFGRTDWAACASRFDDKSAWLLGEKGRQTFESLVGQDTNFTPPSIFPDGGYCLFVQDRGLPTEILGMVDCGPLGYRSIAAHGHADALSFVLTVGGASILADPGTFAYHTEPVWRTHFRSTRAHNTICVDGLDQSTSGGAFLWLQKARAQLVECSDDGAVQWFSGRHDGYMRLEDPVAHNRSIKFDREQRRFEVVDTVIGATSHRATMTWQFAPECIVNVSDNSLRVRSGSATVTLTVTGTGSAPVLVQGREEPPSGWVSRRYGTKEPATCAMWDCSVPSAARIVTMIEVSFE